MAKSRIALTLVVGSVCLFGEAKVAVRTILDCSRPDANAIIKTGKGGVGSVTKESGGLRIAFSNVTDAVVRFPGMGDALCGIAPDQRPRTYCLDYEVRSFDGTAQMRFYSPSPCSHALPLLVTGRRERVLLRPEIVSNRKGWMFSAPDCKDIQMTVSGSGDILIAALGGLNEGSAPRAHDQDLPRVDPESFAIFPEPRVLRDDGTCRPLAAYGTSLKLEGEVPPGAVSYFSRTMKRFFGLDYRVGGQGSVVFSVSEASDIPGYDAIRFDGFAIRVRKDGILVVAKDPKGVVYGAHVLCDIVKMSSGDTGPAVVRQCEIVDWPRMGVRVLSDMFMGGRRKNPYDPDFYAGMIDEFGVASRFNMFAIEPKSYYRWACAPDTPFPPVAWTRADFERVVDRVNANAMTMMPKMNGLGHANIFPLTENSHARLGEDGDTHIVCTANPEMKRLMFDSFEEILAICSKNPKFAPKYFHPGMDECRWKTDEKPPEARCRLCAGRAKKDIFLEQVMRIDDWCASKGLRMVMWADMIRPHHNGVNRFRCADIEPRIPRDVIYDNWSSYDMFDIASSARAGHENWKTLTGYKDDPTGDADVTGYGLYLCTINWWLARGISRVGNGPYGLMAQRILSDQMWRRPPSRFGGDGGSRSKVVGDGRSLVRRWGDFIMRNWSRKPIPFGTDRFVPLDLGGSATLELKAEMEPLSRLAPVPLSVACGNGVVRAVEAPDGGVSFPVGRRAASLLLLHTAGISPEDAKAFHVRKTYPDWTEGPVVAAYDVTYDDGTHARIEAKYGWNVVDWRSRDVLYEIFARYSIEGRGLWEGRLDSDPSDPLAADTAVATLYEWVNPHPEKGIRSLTLSRGTDGPYRYALLGLTTREVAADVCMKEEKR